MSEALIESGELDFGVVVDGEAHRAFALRPATLVDVYRAAEAVPPKVDMDSAPAVKVAYQMAIEDALILCQLVKLGTLDPVPLPAALMETMAPEDMELLRAAAERLKKKLRLSRNTSPATASPSASSSGPASS